MIQENKDLQDLFRNTNYLKVLFFFIFYYNLKLEPIES